MPEPTREKIYKLIKQYLGGDKSDKKAAEERFQDMGAQIVRPGSAA